MSTCSLPAREPEIVTGLQSRADLSESRLRLSFLVRSLGPQFESIAFEARDDVHVRMLDDLSRMLAIVHVDVDPVCADRALDLSCEQVYRARDCRPVLRRNIEDIF